MLTGMNRATPVASRGVAILGLGSSWALEWNPLIWLVKLLKLLKCLLQRGLNGDNILCNIAIQP